MFTKLPWLFVLILLPAVLLKAQTGSPVQNQGDVLMPYLSYAVHLPGGDLAERFGTNFSLGTGLEWMAANGDWILGLQGNFLFGSQVKTDVLSALRTDAGFIIGNNRLPADIRLRQRGWLIQATAGRHFPFSAGKRGSGLRLTASAGILQHRIRIQDDPQQSVPQLSGDYKKGYDRLTNGLSITEFIGYELLAADKRLNFFFGLELTQAFTQNRREINFDTQNREEKRRIDLLYGLRLGWIIPFYMGRSGEDIYY